MLIHVLPCHLLILLALGLSLHCQRNTLADLLLNHVFDDIILVIKQSFQQVINLLLEVLLLVLVFLNDLAVFLGIAILTLLNILLDARKLLLKDQKSVKELPVQVFGLDDLKLELVDALNELGRGRLRS